MLTFYDLLYHFFMKRWVIYKKNLDFSVKVLIFSVIKERKRPEKKWQQNENFDCIIWTRIGLVAEKVARKWFL